MLDVVPTRSTTWLRRSKSRLCNQLQSVGRYRARTSTRTRRAVSLQMAAFGAIFGAKSVTGFTWWTIKTLGASAQCPEHGTPASPGAAQHPAQSDRQHHKDGGGVPTAAAYAGALPQSPQMGDALLHVAGSPRVIASSAESSMKATQSLLTAGPAFRRWRTSHWRLSSLVRHRSRHRKDKDRPCRPPPRGYFQRTHATRSGHFYSLETSLRGARIHRARARAARLPRQRAIDCSTHRRVKR